MSVQNQELVRKAREGDNAAFGQFWARYEASEERLAPDFVESWSELAWIYAEMGHTEESLGIWPDQTGQFDHRQDRGSQHPRSQQRQPIRRHAADVPSGFGGAGKLKLISYGSGRLVRHAPHSRRIGHLRCKRLCSGCQYALWARGGSSMAITPTLFLASTACCSRNMVRTASPPGRPMPTPPPRRHTQRLHHRPGRSGRRHDRSPHR